MKTALCFLAAAILVLSRAVAARQWDTGAGAFARARWLALGHLGASEPTFDTFRVVVRSLSRRMSDLLERERAVQRDLVRRRGDAGSELPALLGDNPLLGDGQVLAGRSSSRRAASRAST
jgi:hypothetical protein